MSRAAAEREYGVVLGDAGATRQLRDEMRGRRGEPAFFDRGPGYERLAAASTRPERQRASDAY